MIVDVHSHFCPLPYRYFLERLGSKVPSRLSRWLAMSGPMSDLKIRIEMLDQNNVMKQVLSVPAPNGVVFEQPEEALGFAQAANDGLAEAVDYSGFRFSAFGMLPMEFPDLAVEELKRITEQLHFPGVMVGANIAGVELDDPQFEDFWKTADAIGSIVYLHPTERAMWNGFSGYSLDSLFRYVLDTSVTASRLFFSGILERYPQVRLVIPHLGGVLPYMVNRLDRGYAKRAVCRSQSSQPPSYFLRSCYLDSVSFNPLALQMAISTVGAEHILLGSDMPHDIGSLDEAIAIIQSLGLDALSEQAVLGRNAVTLLNIT